MKVSNVKGAPGIREARRRAGILERYNAIVRPTAEDDAAAAAEMGLSVDRLIRLATAWRLYRSETLLIGQTAALAREGGAARHDVMAQEIDLERVRPERRAETMRRIQIIQRHIASIETGLADPAEAAEAVGVCVMHFQELLRNWKLHARAEALPGATRRSTSWRRRPDHARRQELLRSTLEHADPDGPLKHAYHAFRAACVAEDLKPLSLPRFYGIVQELRAARDAHDDAGHLSSR